MFNDLLLNTDLSTALRSVYNALTRVVYPVARSWRKGPRNWQQLPLQSVDSVNYYDVASKRVIYNADML